MPLHKQQEMLSFHQVHPLPSPSATQPFLRSLLTALPVFPAVSPLTQDRPSSSPFLPPGAGEEEAGTPAGALRPLQGPAPNSCGLSHHIQVSSPSSGKTNGRVRPTSSAGEMSAKMPLEGEWGKHRKERVSSQPSQPPSTNPRVCPTRQCPSPGPTCLPGG